MTDERPDHLPDGLHALPAEFATLARLEVELGRKLVEARARVRRAEEEYEAIEAEREALAERRMSLAGAWLTELSRRAAEAEAARRSLERRARAQEAGLRDICEILRQLDDPYGFGSSVDDRIAGDGTADEAGG